MENTVKAVCQFNDKAGLSNRPFEDKLEASFLIEEALEDFDRLDVLAALLSKNTLGVEVKSSSPKDIARHIVGLAGGVDAELTDLQRFDKHIDAIVYAVGGAYKLGLTPQQLEAGIAAVMHSNMKKIGAGKDEHGKALKPDNWNEIEAEQVKKLQAILDKRS